jgi:hypothetical protein
MLELDKLVVNRIITDSSMISYLGTTANDNRVYAWYPATDIVYTTGIAEAAIIYRNSILRERPYNWSYPSQIPNIQYFFRILSISQLKLGQISERLIDLFDLTSLESDNWTVKWIELSSAINGMNEGSPTHPIISKNVTFSFNIVVKNEVV